MLDDGTYRLSLIALHVEPGWEQWTPLLGEHTTPALVYEVIQVQEEGEPELVFEGRIIEPGTGELAQRQPVRSPLIEPLAAWWSRETETDPPPELTPAKERRQCKRSGQRRQ